MEFTIGIWVIPEKKFSATQREHIRRAIGSIVARLDSVVNDQIVDENKSFETGVKNVIIEEFSL